MYPYIEKIFDVVAISATAVAVYHIWQLKREIRALVEDKEKLQKEITDLQKVGGLESVKLVERTLGWLAPPVCTICEQLILLGLCTTFVEAMERLEPLMTTAANWKKYDTTGMKRVLEVLDRASKLRLWLWSLQKPDNRPDPEPMIVRRAIEVYATLVPHMSDAEKQVAIEFCVGACATRGDLRREAAVLLLPCLLKRSDDQQLVDTYRMLLGIGQNPTITEEQKRLLIGILSGMSGIVEVSSPGVSGIWEDAFWVAARDLKREWEKSEIWTVFRDAFELRRSHSTADELAVLGAAVAEFVRNNDIVSHEAAYRYAAKLAAEIRMSLVKLSPNDPSATHDPNAADIRPVNRSIVPEGTNIAVQITPNGETPESAKLVNFSVDDGVWKQGAWATIKKKPQWTRIPANDWWSATVIVDLAPLVPKQKVRFEQARVLGPLGPTPDNFYGFRIQFGQASSEEAMNQLRYLGNQWPKR